MKIKIVLVDDHALVMKGFTNLLSKRTNIKIVGEATSSNEALILVKKTKPDIVLMDINMPNETGIECTKKISKIAPSTKIIMLTMHNDEQYILRALSVGAKGYIMKNCELDELVQAIEEVHNGNEFFSKNLEEEIITSIKEKLNEQKEDLRFEELTRREIQIIKAIAQGLNNKEISDKLYISDRTVNTHRTNIIAKMKVKNSVELVVQALRENII